MDPDYILMVVGVLAFIASIIIRTQLKDHVSMEKVRDLHDSKSIFGNGSGPSADVLNETGLKLLHLSWVLMAIGILFIVLPGIVDRLFG